MKEIKAVIQSFKVNSVTDALQAVPGVSGITAWEVRGFGHQRGHAGLEERAPGAVSYVAKTLLLLVVPDEAVEGVLGAIHQHAHTGNVGDGKVFVTPVVDVLQVRTGARGPAAL